MEVYLQEEKESKYGYYAKSENSNAIIYNKFPYIYLRGVDMGIMEPKFYD